MLRRLLWKGDVKIHVSTYWRKYLLAIDVQNNVLIGICQEDVKLHCKKITFLYYQECLWFDELKSTTLSPLMCSFHEYCQEQDGLFRRITDVVRWADPKLIQNKVLLYFLDFWQHLLHNFVKRGKDLSLSASHFIAWNGRSLSVFWSKEEITENLSRYWRRLLRNCRNQKAKNHFTST